MSLEIALSGINAVGSQLNSISNNIANSSTYGYKMGRTNFSSVYSGSQAMGVEIGSQTQDIGRGGGVVSTGRSLDAAINGSGFFVTRGADGANQYTRVGIFNADKDGFLRDSSGAKVQGYGVMPGSNALGALGDIRIPTGLIPAKASDVLRFSGNMSSSWEKPALAFSQDDPSTFNSSAVSTVYDSRGEKHNVTQYFVKNDDSSVTVHYAMDGKMLDDGATPPVPVTSTLSFDTNGQLTSAANVALDLGTPAGAAALALNFDYTGTTLFAGESSTSLNAANGYASGSMIGSRIDTNGEIIAQYSNGQTMAVGVVAIANFPNENALIAASATGWVESPASGVALISAPGSGKAGTLTPGALEQSNVDLTAELVNLMTAQRNYQANTKVISTESQIMQALMQAL